MSLAAALAAGVAIGYLPGAILFRLPVLRRDRRAALAAEERFFWQIVLSISWSLAVTMALAAASAYTLPRLVGANVALSLAGLALSRGRLLLGGQATRLSAGALLPFALIVLAGVRFFPAAEYIVGGKDPGVYINEGISLARTGTLFRTDPVIAEVPDAARSLFFPKSHVTEYYGLRFMGVFLNDPSTGAVIPGFPHLFPASVSIGYDLAGLRGATSTVAVWATLGLLAVYFFGARLFGAAPAFLGCALLGLNVIEVWYARYPNAEVVMQTLLFAGLLAFARSQQDDDPYFGWVAGAMAGLLIFLRFDSFLAIAGTIGAGSLAWIVDRRPIRWSFCVILATASGLAWIYYTGPMKAYFWQYDENLPPVLTGLLYIATAAAAVLVLGTQRRWLAAPLRTWMPLLLSAGVVTLAIYALFFRVPGGRLTDYDAYALRTFRDLYVFWPALVTAIAGFVLLSRQHFWRDPAFFLVLAAFSVFFFYKIRIVPEHFWIARRFLPIILPGLLLLAAAAAIGVPTGDQRRSWRRALAGTAFLAFIGWQFLVAAAPVAAHVEYRGAIRHVERLARESTERDLVIVESRNAQSDMHTFAVPLAYAYGRNVLVLESPRPDRRVLEAFLEHALTRYDRVLFVGGAGTDLLSRRISAAPVAFVTVELPEYETTPWNEYPQGPRKKDLGYSVYELTLGGPERRGFVLDVGYLDDLNVLRFMAREITDGRTFRWTGPQSFIAVTGLTGAERELVLTMHDGGRPAAAPPAAVEIALNDVVLGTVQVAHGFQEYRITLPAEVVRAAALGQDPALLRLRSTPWSPRELLGVPDDRALGVMIDRVEIH